MRDLLRLLKFARRYWVYLVFSVILMACVGAAHGMIALLVGPIFDRVLNPASLDTRVLLFTDPVFHHAFYLDQITPGLIQRRSIWTMVAFAIVAVFLTKGLCDYLANYLVNYVGFSSVTDLRNTVFDKVVKQGAQFFEAHSTGRLMSSIMNDIEKIQVASSHILADLLRQVFIVLGLLFVILDKDWKLALVSLTVLPFVLVPTARIGRRIRRTSRRSQDQAAELNEILQETLSGHQVVKAFAMEQFESRRFRQTAQGLLKINLKYVRQQALASPLIELFGAITIVLLLTYARTQIKTHQLTAGQFTSFVIALLMIYEPVKRLTGIHNIFEQAIGASQKVFEYLEHAEEIEEKPGAVKLERFGEAVCFDNVSFRYPLSPNGFQLRGLNLEVKAGEVVAVVGPSGAGKTTLVNLVARFYDATSGAVRIDGRDVRELDLGAGHLPVQRHGGQQHRLWAAGHAAPSDPRGRPIRAGRRIHQPPARRVRHGDRRARREVEWRPAAAYRYRARAVEERSDIDPGRGHFAPGHRVGAAGAARALEPDGGPHGDRDRPPAIHHTERGQDCSARAGRYLRSRHARGTGERRRDLSEIT
jgi:subfamily B ATP-binding cassette protein MsbA